MLIMFPRSLFLVAEMSLCLSNDNTSSGLDIINYLTKAAFNFFHIAPELHIWHVDDLLHIASSRIEQH